MRLILLILLFSPVVVFASIEITYVECNPVGSDADGEFIKIKNTGSETIDITGWKFFDGKNHKLNTPPKNGGVGDMLLTPGEVVILANKADKVSMGGSVIDTVMSLSNSGDTLKLFNKDGIEQVSVSYTKEQVVEGASCIAASGNDTKVINPVNETVDTIFNEYTVQIEPPQDIYVRVPKEISGIYGGYISISPEMYNATGKAIKGKCRITFGDGSSKALCDAEHVYRYPGEYIAQVEVWDGDLKDKALIKVNIKEPQIYAVVSRDKKYVELRNVAAEPVELNGWSVVAGFRRFRIPDATVIPANASVKLPSEVTGFTQLDISDGVAELRNIFNNLVQMDKDFEQAANNKIIKEIDKKSIKAVDSNITIGKPESPIVKKQIIKTTNIAKSKYKSEGIIGYKLRVDPIDNTPSESVNNLSSAKIKSDKNNQIAAISFTKQETHKESSIYIWLSAILALIILTVLPLFIRRDIGEQESNESNNSDRFNGGFKVEEVE